MAGQTIAISVLADTKKLKSGLNDATGGLGKFGKGLAGVGIAVGVMAAGAVAAIGKLGGEAFAAVAEIERLNAQTSAALKSTGNAAGRSMDQILGHADALERLTGVEAEQIQTGQNLLLTFTQIKGQNFDAATKSALDLSVAMGTDMKSAATLVGKALNDPIKGVGALSKVGVQLTEDQKALVKSMTETGDVAGAQGVILGVLGEQFGGSAEAFGGTFLGTLEKVKNSFGTLTEALVADLLPVATVVLGKLDALFLAIADSPAFAGIVDGVSSVVTAIATGQELDLSGIADMLLSARDSIVGAALGALGGILDAATQIIPQVIASTAGLITTVVTFLANNAPALLAAAVAMLTGLIAAVTTILPPLIASLVGMLPSIITALLGMIPALLDAGITLLTAIIDAIPVILPPLIGAIVTLLPVIIESLISLIPKLIDGALNLFMAIVTALPKIIPMLINGIISLLPKLVSSLISMIPQLIGGAVTLFTGIVSALPKIIPQLVQALINLAPKMISTLIGLVPQLVRAGVDLIGGLVRGLWNAAGSVGGALLKIAQDAIGGFLSFLGIKSPSRLFMGYGGHLVAGLVKGIAGGKGDLSREMGALAGVASGSFDASLTAAPLGSLGAQRVRSDYRATADAQTRVVAEREPMRLDPADIELLARRMAYHSKDLTLEAESIRGAYASATANAYRQGRS